MTFLHFYANKWVHAKKNIREWQVKNARTKVVVCRKRKNEPAWLRMKHRQNTLAGVRIE